MSGVKLKYDGARGPGWALLSWLDVPSKVHPGEVYLRRLRVVNTPWFGVYVHWIYEEDSDRFHHDHPWGFVSLVLRGGYTEEFYASFGAHWVRRVWRRGSLHWMRRSEAHRIVALSGQPTVTLVVTGPRRQVWGFWTPDGKVPWDVIDQQ